MDGIIRHPISKHPSSVIPSASLIRYPLGILHRHSLRILHVCRHFSVSIILHPFSIPHPSSSQHPPPPSSQHPSSVIPSASLIRHSISILYPSSLQHPSSVILSASFSLMYFVDGQVWHVTLHRINAYINVSTLTMTTPYVIISYRSHTTFYTYC